MFKYWAKNRLLLDFILSIVLSSVFVFAFFYPQHSRSQKISSNNDVCLNSNIDFQIPNPSVDQLNEIKNESFIKNVFGYYYTSTSFTGKKNSKVNLLMSDQIENLSFTTFNKNMVVKSADKTQKFAYLDERAASDLGVGLGDQISFNIGSANLGFTVCSIYKNTSLFDGGTVVVEFSGDVKTAYESKTSSKSYSAAFLECSDVTQCSNYLNSYIPLGRLRERSEFDTDEEYNAYNNAVMSGSYSNEITNYSAKREFASTQLDKAKTSTIVMCYVGAVVVGVSYFVINEILRSRKSEKNYFSKVVKNKKSIKTYRIASFIFSFLLFAGLTLLSQLLFKNILMIVVPLIIASGLFVVTLLINLVQDRKYILVKNKNESSIIQKKN